MWNVIIWNLSSAFKPHKNGVSNYGQILTWIGWRLDRMIEKEEEMNNVDEALFPKSSFILKTHVRGYNFEER